MITLIANAWWIGITLFAFCVYWFLQGDEFSTKVHRSSRKAAGAAACWFSHRTYWNLGLAHDNPADPNRYHPMITEYQHALIVLVVLGSWFTFAAIAEWIEDPTLLAKARRAFALCVAGTVGAWLAYYKLAQSIY